MPRSSDFSCEFAAKHKSYEVVSVELCTAWHYHIVCGRLGDIGADNQRSTIRPRRRPTPLSAEPMLIPTVPPFWLHYALDFGTARLWVLAPACLFCRIAPLCDASVFVVNLGPGSVELEGEMENVFFERYKLAPLKEQ